MRDQQRRGKCRRADHGRKAGKCLTHADPVEPQTKGWRGQHGTERKKTDEIAVDQAGPGERRRIHALLHHDVGHPAAGREQHAIAEDEPAERGCDGRESYPGTRKRASQSHQKRCTDPPEQPRRQIGADREEHRRYAEHGGKFRATGLEELLQRHQKNAERIDRAERQANNGGRRNSRTGPLSNANRSCRHEWRRSIRGKSAARSD